MASFTKRGDRWRAQVRINGVRKTKSFRTKSAAQAWALQAEVEIEEGLLGKIPKGKTFGDLLDRYSREVSPLKRGHIREVKTIALIVKDDIAQIPLESLAAKHIAEWRDRRQKTVSGSTVNREMNILSHACTVARREWGWLKQSPTKDVTRPKENPPRSRRPTKDETDRIIHASGYRVDEPPNTVSARVGAAYLFAIETGMRAGEIAGLQNEHVFERHVHVPVTKNGNSRDVPLSSEAQRILKQVNGVSQSRASVFGLKASSIDAVFRKLKKQAGITDLHFHDTRREALTRLSKRLSVMELARVSGHRDLRILQHVYYAPTIEDLADKLD